MIDENKLIEDLIPILNENCDMFLAGKIIGTIDRQPHVGGWIHVSERLPDIDINNPDQSVLISCWSKDDDYFVQEALVYRDANEQVIFDSLYWKDKVLAWMPLPEPYKVGERDD